MPRHRLEPKIAPSGDKMLVGGLSIPITSELTACLYGFANHIKPEAKEYYFWRIADILWNNEDLPEPLFERHPWADLMIKEAIANKYLAVGGSASCVSGDTRMMDPITGEAPTIQSLCESNTRPWVMTLNGPVLADVPYLKGTKELFEFRLSNGSVFRCTEDHRLLTPSGWIYAKQTNVGSVLYGYAPCPPETSQDTDPSTHPQDVPHCSDIVGDSQYGCPSCPRLCGEQLHEARENARETLPSQADVPAHKGYAFECVDDPSCEQAHSHPCQQSCPSTHSGPPLSSRLGKLLLLHSDEETPSHFSLESQLDDQSQQENDPLHTTEEQVPRFAHTQSVDFSALSEGSECHADSAVALQSKPSYQVGQQPTECSQVLGTVSQSYQISPSNEESCHQPSSSCCLSSHLKVSHVEVESIQSIGVHDFYDLNVPVEHHYFAEGAIHHNSGKSHCMAAWGIVNWLSRPSETLVLMTSTTLREARKRIWGSVITLMSVIDGSPSKIRDSIGNIAYVNERGTLIEKAGLSLIAAEKSKTREAVGKFIGIKQKKVILIGDELSELSEAILNAGLSNLSKNPELQIIGMSNPSSRFDAFGVWSEPKKGWDSVDVLHADEWKTKWGGKYIRLDGERSPNILAGETKYTYLPTKEKLEEDKALLGQESRAYMRMVRAVFFDSDENEGIYLESELAQSGAMNPASWAGTPTPVAGLDPAFTNGGDRTILFTGLVGYSSSGQFVFEFGEYFQLNDDSSNKAVPRTYQIVTQVMNICQKKNISPDNLAVDSTGAGAPFCDVLAGEWSPKFLRVSFGGKPSDKRVSANSRLTGQELYTNRVSELWFVGKELTRTGQIAGIRNELAAEIVARNYEMVKSGTLKIKIESKPDFKARFGRSPDIADAAFLALDCARQRHGLVAMDPPKEGSSFAIRPRRTMKAIAASLNNNEAVLLAD